MKEVRILFLGTIFLMTSCISNFSDDSKYSNLINSYPIMFEADLNAEYIKVRSAFPDETTPWKDKTLYDHVLKTDNSLYKGYVRYAKGSDIYFFSSPSGSFFNNYPSIHSVVVPESQTGQAQPRFFWAHATASAASLQNEEITCQANFKSFSTEVQMEVAKSLDIVKIEVSGVNLCGEEYLSVAEKDGVSTSGTGGSFLSFQNLGSSITISNPSGKLQGNVVFNITPDSYDTSSKEYFNSSAELSLTLVNGSKKVAETVIPLSSRLSEGKENKIIIPNDLEFFNPKPTGRLIILQNDDELRISVADAPKGCRFFYETGTSEVFTPTMMSEEFDAEKGFRLQTTDTFTSELVKVLVHDDSGVYSDLILNGYVRNWNIVKGSSLIRAYDDYKATYSCDGIRPGDSIIADGIQAKTCSSANGFMSAETTYTLLENICLSSSVINDGADCYCRYSTFGPAGSVISLTKENKVISTWTVPTDCSATGKQASAVFGGNELEGLESGTAIGLSYSTKEALCQSFAILETGKNIIIPEPEKTKVYPVFKIDGESEEPTVILDAASIGTEVMGEVKFYYSVSSKSFEDAGIPTVYSEELTDETKILANTVPTKHDELYMIILCAGAHHIDSYTKLLFRTWHFGWNYEPTAKPASGTTYDFYLANTDYYGMTYTQPIGCVKSYGNRAQFKNNCTITMKALLGGTVMMCVGCYKADEITSNNGISFWAGDNNLGAPNHPKIQWDINPSFMMFVSESGNNVIKEESLIIKTGSKWYQFAPIACVEYLSE